MTQPTVLELARAKWRQRNPDATPAVAARADELLELHRTLGRAQWVLDYEETERELNLTERDRP